MNTVAHFEAQPAFAEALLQPRTTPAGLRVWNGASPQLRFDVYRNNVMSSLLEALGDTYPTICRLVGDEYFDTMASVYFAEDGMPHTPVPVAYGAGFPNWLQRFPPVRELPYLSDVARLESMLLACTHAADAVALGVDDLRRYAEQPDHAISRRLALHPAAALVQFGHAAVSIWRAHQRETDDTLRAIDITQAEYALIAREDEAAIVVPLDEALYRACSGVASCRTLGELASCCDDEVAQRALAILVRHGALINQSEASR